MPEELSSYATRPLAFFLRYVQLRSVAHAAIVVAVILAVGCSVATQYGVKLLVETLGCLMRGRTVIAIAHRLSTVRNFDRILVLHKGRIVQDGAPDALLRTDGIYRSLVESEMKRLSATRSRAA